EKPVTVRGEWAVELGLNAIGISQQKVGAPLGAESSDVYERETRSGGEIHVSSLRAVHFKRRLESGRCIKFFHDANQKPRLSVLFGEPIASGVEAANSGHACQHVVEFLRVQRFVEERSKIARCVRFSFAAGAFNLDELRHGKFSTLPRLTCLLVSVPVGIAQG